MGTEELRLDLLEEVSRVERKLHDIAAIVNAHRYGYSRSADAEFAREMRDLLETLLERELVACYRRN